MRLLTLFYCLLSQLSLSEHDEIKKIVTKTFSGTENLLFLDLRAQNDLIFDKSYELSKAKSGWEVTLVARSRITKEPINLKILLSNSTSGKKLDYSLICEISKAPFFMKHHDLQSLISLEGHVQNPSLDLSEEPSIEASSENSSSLRLILKNGESFKETFSTN